MNSNYPQKIKIIPKDWKLIVALSAEQLQDRFTPEQVKEVFEYQFDVLREHMNNPQKARIFLWGIGSWDIRANTVLRSIKESIEHIRRMRGKGQSPNPERVDNLNFWYKKRNLGIDFVRGNRKALKGYFNPIRIKTGEVADKAHDHAFKYYKNDKTND